MKKLIIITITLIMNFTLFLQSSYSMNRKLQKKQEALAALHATRQAHLKTIVSDRNREEFLQILKHQEAAEILGVIVEIRKEMMKIKPNSKNAMARLKVLSEEAQRLKTYLHDYTDESAQNSLTALIRNLNDFEHQLAFPQKQLKEIEVSFKDMETTYQESTFQTREELQQYFSYIDELQKSLSELHFSKKSTEEGTQKQLASELLAFEEKVQINSENFYKITQSEKK